MGGALALGLAGGDPAEAQQGTPVDLELVLAIDTSGSVDPWEFNLQLRGIAAAFRDPEVQAAIEGSTPGGLAVTLVQWSGPQEQLATTGWAVLTDGTSATAFAAQTEADGRQFMGRTAIASVLEFATLLLTHNRFDGYRKVIDLSGDGRANEGRAPGDARDAAVAADITVNALPIMTDVADLDLYYRDQVIGGPGAFLLSALDFDDFARAIRQKLLREIGGTPVGEAPADAILGARLAAADRQTPLPPPASDF